MASNRQILGIGALGVLGYLVWKRGLLGGARGMVESADIAQAIGDSQAEIDACGNAPLAAGSWLYAAHGVAEAGSGAPDMTNARLAAQIGGGVAQIAGSINPVAGVVAGVGTAIATTLFSIFSSAPPDPVIRLVIAEMPYAWTARSNLPPEGGRWALDRCGYLHEILGDLGVAGYDNREVVAVNWKVFGMMPQSTPISDAGEIDHVRMPRPADPAILRATLGQDIRFYIGRETRLRGPWDADSRVPPLAGSPAMWAEFAGTYTPTHTESAGEF
jgi:hypothetical protein